MKISFGTGSPEGAVTADISSLYFRSDATDSSESWYIKDSGTGDTGWSLIAFGGGATSLDDLIDVDASPAQDGDLLQFVAGSVNEWHPTNTIELSMVSSSTGAQSNIFPLVIVGVDGRLETTNTPINADSFAYVGSPSSDAGGLIAIGSGNNGAIINLTGTNLSGSSQFQELSGGTIIWQSFGLAGDLASPIAISDSPGGFAIYKDSDGTGQSQSYGYFQCSGHNGTSYINSCVLGAFYDKDGPAIGDAVSGLPGKWIICTANGINESFPQPALSVFSDKTVEVVRGTFRIRLGHEIQFWNEDNDSYVSLRSPDSPSNGSDNEVNLILPSTIGNNGEILTTDGTGAMFWAPGGGTVQFEISQAIVLDLLDSVYYDGNDWQPAQANSADTLGTHIVTSASHPFYTLTQAGRITIAGHGLTVGQYYFTDSKVAGTLTSTEPSTYSNPLVFVETENIIHILPFRPSSVNAFSTYSDWVPIFAEESGALSTATSSGFQFSFGDSDVDDGNGIVIPYDFSIMAVTLSCQSSTTGTVEVWKGADTDSTSSATAATVSLTSEQHNSNILVSPVSGNAGDWLTFKTTSGSGGTGARVCAWIRPR